MNISNIYAGKPDATDEIRERGYEEFANNYIKPTGVNIDRLASTEYGTPFFIMGDKGTGKTALLHFLENYVRTIDSAACSSFVYFESGYSQVQREKLNAISQTISTSISIDNKIATVGGNGGLECDFTYIWKWQLYQKIIIDNEEFNGGLFIDNDPWRKFVAEIGRIDKTISKGKMRVPAKVSLTATANPQLGTFTPGMKIEPVDFTQCGFNRTNSYAEFEKILNNADELFEAITRTDIPYYIFIDELEAYRAENETFYRDLRMIRDLLFTVKRLNDRFGSGTKIVCSVRLEILNAINRFIQSNQLHKIMQGYDERLTWEHTNTNSFSHPIIGVLLRRIQIAEEKAAKKEIDKDEIIQKWFVSSVYNTHICTYILDNTWHKPRDIVRLLLAAQSKNSRNFSVFNQNTFETFMPVYSKQCLVEVREEMRALYTAEEIECIFNCLQGFRSVFSFNEIVERAKSLYPNSVMANDPHAVLNDMYRIGIIGNVLLDDRSTRWVYKEQYKLYIDDPWRIVIHPSLRIELSVSSRIDKHIDKKKQYHRMQVQAADSLREDYYVDTNTYNAKVKSIRLRYILVSFVKDGYEQTGYLSMKRIGKPDIQPGDLAKYFCVGDELRVRISGYNHEFLNWYVSIVSEEQ